MQLKISSFFFRFARSPKPLLTGIACLTCFLIGLVFVTGAGEYWLTLFDRYCTFICTPLELLRDKNGKSEINYLSMWFFFCFSYGAMGLTFIALVEIISVMYVYGHDRFMQDIAMMTGGKRPSRYWEYCLRYNCWRHSSCVPWHVLNFLFHIFRFVAPILLALVTVLSVVSQFTKSPTYSVWSSAEVWKEDVLLNLL